MTLYMENCVKRSWDLSLTWSCLADQSQSNAAVLTAKRWESPATSYTQHIQPQHTAGREGKGALNTDSNGKQWNSTFCLQLIFDIVSFLFSLSLAFHIAAVLFGHFFFLLVMKLLLTSDILTVFMLHPLQNAFINVTLAFSYTVFQPHRPSMDRIGLFIQPRSENNINWIMRENQETEGDTQINLPTYKLLMVSATQLLTAHNQTIT